MHYTGTIIQSHSSAHATCIALAQYCGSVLLFEIFLQCPYCYYPGAGIILRVMRTYLYCILPVQPGAILAIPAITPVLRCALCWCCMLHLYSIGIGTA
jgi:hypothetical protein